MKKMTSRRGETLAETLVAMLIISLAFLMLATGIVTAAKVNHAAEAQNLEFTTDVQKTVPDFQVTVEYGSITGAVSDVTGYQTGRMADGAADYTNGYYYYEKMP